MDVSGTTTLLQLVRPTAGGGGVGTTRWVADDQGGGIPNHARIKYVGESQSCMVQNARYWLRSEAWVGARELQRDLCWRGVDAAVCWQRPR